MIKVVYINDEEHEGFIKSVLVQTTLDDGFVKTYSIGSSMEGFLTPAIVDEIVFHQSLYPLFEPTAQPANKNIH